MLTRIEIDGFKSFDNFGVDLNLFVVIVGANATGKSNLFDAIRLLSLLATGDIRSAVREIRGEPHELFRIGPDGKPGIRMRFAVEVLLGPRAQDAWGSEVTINHTRIRYEVEIERRRDDRGVERLFVYRESALPIQKAEDRWPTLGSSTHENPWSRYLRYGRGSPLLTTAEEDGVRSFEIDSEKFQGGWSRSAGAATRTVLSSFESEDFELLFGLREEMRSWRIFQPDPVALRRPVLTQDDEEMKPDGSNLAAILARILQETKTHERPRGELSEIAIDLAGLIPGVIGLDLVEDPREQKYSIDFVVGHGPPVSARIASDGTLRLLAMLTFLRDPGHPGLVCFEEPENGVHPSRLAGLIEVFRDHGNDLLIDPDPQDYNPPTQVIMNSHSPVMLANLEESEMMFADMISVIDPETRTITRKTRLRPVGSHGFLLEGDQYVLRSEIDRYLATVASGA